MRSRLHVFLIALGAAGAGLAAACSKTTTSLTAPSSDKCQVSVGSAPSSFTASGGQGSLAIATSRDCTWSISTNANWVSIGSGQTGQGEASVSYTVAPNPLPSARTGAIVVASQSVAVNQAPAPCVFTLNRAADAVPAAGGRLSVDVATLGGCSWNATSPVAWVVVASGQSGNAPGTVGLSVAANTAGLRTAAVTIAGQTYTVTQAAAPPPAPDPAPPAPAPTPTPAPGPTPPAPAPTPTPPPGPTPPATRVEFSGTIANVSGRCPAVTFTVGAMTILTDRSTDFTKSKCGDVDPGRNASGAGIVQPDGTVKATDLRVSKD